MRHKLLEPMGKILNADTKLTLGERLTLARKDAGLATVQAAAKVLPFSQEEIRADEEDRMSHNQAHVLRVVAHYAEAYGVSRFWLTTGFLKWPPDELLDKLAELIENPDEGAIKETVSLIRLIGRQPKRKGQNRDDSKPEEQTK